MLKCKKCGAELDEDQRACIMCGEMTAAGGKFDYGEQKEPWRPTRKQVYAAAGVVLLVIIFLIARSLQTVPPDRVASEWLDAVNQRQFAAADDYMTQEFHQELNSKMMDLRAVSDELRTEIADNRATVEVAQPVFDNPSSPKAAEVRVQLRYDGGTDGRELTLQMVKIGRQWRVNSMM